MGACNPKDHPDHPTSVRLVPIIGTPDDGKKFDPKKKTRCAVKHGFFGKESNHIHCPNGHLMKGKIAREIFSKYASCGATRSCDSCDADIPSSSSYYHCDCKECQIDFCPHCCREALGMPVVGDSLENPVEILPGDILMAWPNWAESHHVILVVGELQRESHEFEIFLEVPPGVELWSAQTVESTGLYTGKDTYWVRAQTFFGRDPHAGTAVIIGDLQSGGNDYCIGEDPVPVKLIMNPLREDWGGPGVDARIFREVMEACTEHSQAWNLGTGIKSVLANAAHAGITVSDFASAQKREELMEEIRASWERPPICSSVPVKVWQQYFERVCKNDAEVAECILNYMPVICDRTTPSSLTRALTDAGWVLADNFEANA